MKRLAILLLVGFLGYGYLQESGFSLPWQTTTTAGALQRAYDNRQSDVQVEGEGVVVQVLPDDLKGSRHQRFILELDGGQTVLVAHNIDLAPRIEALQVGDRVKFFGEYEWNSRGGVVHWTHHDPGGRHVAGWLKHRDKTYQ